MSFREKIFERFNYAEVKNIDGKEFIFIRYSSNLDYGDSMSKKIFKNKSNQFKQNTF